MTTSSPDDVKKRILIVEDDPDVAESLAEVLESEGFRTAKAENGLKALDAIREKEHRPDLILLDLMMPVMDGWAFRREQRHMDGAAAIPVVVLTADGDARRKAASIDAQGYISKPVSIGALLRVIERVWERTRG